MMFSRGTRHAGQGGGLRGAVNAFTGTRRLVIRRMRQDALPLVGVIALIALTSSIAVGVPRTIETTLDEAASEAVSVAGHEADLLLAAPVGSTQEPRITTAERLTTFGGELPSRLPRSLSEVLGEVTTSILGPTLAGSTTIGRVEVQVGVLDAAARDVIEPVTGVLPEESSQGAQDGSAAPTPVVLSPAVADSVGLGVGDTLELAGASANPPVRLIVVGVIDQVTESPASWLDLPNVWIPSESGSDRDALGFTVLTDAGSYDDLSTRFTGSVSGVIRVSFDAARFDMATLSRVSESIDALETLSGGLTESAPLTVTVASGFEEELAPFASAAAAASAQLSALGAGLFGVAMLLLILAFVAVGGRREREIELLRSRGAPLGLTAAHAGVEAVVAVLVGVGVGAGVAIAALGPPDTLGLVFVVVGIAAVTPVIVAVRQAIMADTRAGTVSAKRRLFPAIAVAVVVTLAGTAVIALRSREPDSAATVDPLALVAPVLLAAVVAIVLSPVPALLLPPLRWFVERTRGAGPLVAVTGTGRSSSVLTLTTLTLAVSVAITSLVLTESVSAAQDAAAWKYVGADVRLDGVSDPDAAVAAFESEGGTAAAVTVIGRADLRGDGHSSTVRMLAVDDRYAELLEALPDDRPDRANAASVSRLVDESADSAAAGSEEPVPVLLDPRLSSSFEGETVRLELDGLRVPIRVIDAPFASPGFPTGLLMVVDSEALAAFVTAQGTALPATSQETSVLAVGSTAAAADAGSQIVDRREVLDDARAGALTAGVTDATLLSLVGTGVLAAFGMLLISVLGARRRGRTLALLGTLGVPRRAGIAAAFGELTPVVAGAVLGGAVASAAILVAAGQAFGVGEPAGPGEGVPVGIVVPGWSLVGIVAAATTALALAVLIDTPLSRRTRATAILRSGEDS